MERTSQQSNTLYALLAKLNIMSEKEQLCIQYSKGRTHRSSKLSYQECDTLINDLKAIINPNSNSEYSLLPSDSHSLVRKILSLAHELRWEKPDGKVDIIKLDNWAKERGKFKKALKLHSHSELATLIYQLEQILIKDLES